MTFLHKQILCSEMEHNLITKKCQLLGVKAVAVVKDELYPVCTSSEVTSDSSMCIIGQDRSEALSTATQ